MEINLIDKLAVGDVQTEQPMGNAVNTEGKKQTSEAFAMLPPDPRNVQPFLKERYLDSKNSNAEDKVFTVPRAPSQKLHNSQTSCIKNRPKEDVLNLQALFGRSSTPYSLSLSRTNHHCDLETGKEAVSPVKDENQQIIANIKMQEPKENKKTLSGRQYSRVSLLLMRNNMLSTFNQHSLNRIESEDSLRKLKLWRNDSHCKNCNRSPNDLMPAFFKKKNSMHCGHQHDQRSASLSYQGSSDVAANNVPISLPSDTKDSAIITNRRIGSGRLFMHKSWDNLPSEKSDPRIEKNGVERYAFKKFIDNSVFTSSVEIDRFISSPQKQLANSGTSSNYVKGVVSGSLRGLNSKKIEEKQIYRHNQQNEEPEWFSCGPTSRLDTIELSGFNEDVHRDLEREISKETTENKQNKAENNGDHYNPFREGIKDGGKSKKLRHSDEVENKTRRTLPFHFDHFSSGYISHQTKQNHALTFRVSLDDIHNCRQESFAIPIKNNSQSELSNNHNYLERKDKNRSASLNDFFKQHIHSSEEKFNKLKFTDIPSVDQIEAKWRNKFRGKQNNYEGNKIKAERNTEQLQNFIEQLTKNNEFVSEPVQNLFNSENLTNFIQKQQQQQQQWQYMHNMQQQQAIVANLQMKEILNRPESRMLLLRLARNEISKQGLLVQLANPRITQRELESITAVLTFTAQQQQQQCEILSNNLFVNQLQNLAIAQTFKSQITSTKYPGINLNALPRQISHEVLQTHTNNIMQNAVLKRKLEEQTIQKFLHLSSVASATTISGTRLQQAPVYLSTGQLQDQFHSNVPQRQQDHHGGTHRQQQGLKHEHTRNGSRLDTEFYFDEKSTIFNSSGQLHASSIATHNAPSEHLQYRRPPLNVGKEGAI